jgi:hypothetical protein
MFEDISRSGDGGIYGELLMNRNLKGKYTNLLVVDKCLSNVIKG